MGAASEELQAFETLMTDGDLLADYVNDFFGPEGPMPIETSYDRLAADVAESGYSYQRPQMEMPAPGYQQAPSSEDFWTQFSEVSNRNPEMAWQVLQQMPQGAARSKLFIADS